MIRHVFSGMNPEGTSVFGFKQPSKDEAAHDFLWRAHLRTPGRGEVVIFNRSHYEDVLVVRVHKLVGQAVWSKRYDLINDFEKMLEQIPMKWHRYFPPLIPAQAGIQERTGSPLSRGRAEEEFAIRLERNVR